MTDPRLAAEFPWLRRDPSEILGDARPRSIGELLRAQGLTLEELIESGKEQRARLIEETYGTRAPD